MPDTRGHTECERCGTCCMKGGPALHKDDGNLLQEKYLARESLITVRKGEPVIIPDKRRPVLAETEIVKLKGKPSEWSCVFYERRNSTCSIYQHRPLECILLKCWDTADLQGVAGKDLLSRFDIIAADEPVTEYIHQHERECRLEILSRMDLGQKNTIDQNILAELNELVNRDLALRTKALEHLNLSLALELFYFGRPLFTVLTQFSLLPREVNGKIILVRA